MTPEERAADLYAKMWSCDGDGPHRKKVWPALIAAAIRAAVAEEREACAAMLEPFGCCEFCDCSDHDSACYQAIAASMRASSRPVMPIGLAEPPMNVCDAFAADGDADVSRTRDQPR